MGRVGRVDAGAAYIVANSAFWKVVEMLKKTTLFESLAVCLDPRRRR